MRKVLLGAFISAGMLFFSSSFATTYCRLYIHLENNAFVNADKIVFNIIDQDTNKQYTSTVGAHNQSTSFMMPCSNKYNIYATEIKHPQSRMYLDNSQINLYGNKKYMGNPVVLTGELGIFFPSRFKLID
ncbi:hypothetical protein [Cysteiniphilum marinum]|uniref:hypothetical protein n=1 Tax=Cysteiniphilum marinum TaxID=2774191 RepID=UPI0019397DE5|nr:hypothetical protein [Cysteiniphilum marinum]